MSARLKIARIAIPGILFALTLVFLVGAFAALHTVVTAAPGDTETVGTFVVIGLMTAACAWGAGFIAKVAVDDARSLA